MDFLDPQLLEKAGLASIAMYSLWVNYRLAKEFNKTVANHINHQTESSTQLKDAIHELIKYLKKKK